MEISLGSRVTVEEVKPFAKPPIYCFGLGCFYSSISRAAAIFDINAHNDQIDFINRFDYIDLDPLGEPRPFKRRLNIRLDEFADKSDSWDKAHNWAGTLVAIIQKVLNRNFLRPDSKHSQNLSDILRQGFQDQRIPLLIFGHGGYGLGYWMIGPEKSKAYGLIPVEKLLLNLSGTLNAINPAVPLELRQRYSAVILDTCNPQGEVIKRGLVDHLGVPILYSRNIVGGIPNPSKPVLAIPR